MLSASDSINNDIDTEHIHCYIYLYNSYCIFFTHNRLVKIWDYQNKSCVQTLEGHTQNVTVVAFHPELPIILTGSEDGTVKIWHSSTYRLETTLNYGLERVWSIAHQRGSNDVAIGYDEGSVMIKVGGAYVALTIKYFN